MNTLIKSSDNNCTTAVLVLTCALVIGSPPSHAGEGPAAASAVSQLGKGAGATRVESGDQSGQSVEQALALREILGSVAPFNPLDRGQELADLVRTARRFPSSDIVARSLFRTLGPKPQILSAEFDPADGKLIRMLTQDTVVRTDVPLTPIPDWALDFADALAGEFMLGRAEEILNKALSNSATHVWTRQAKLALDERMAAARAPISPDLTAGRLGWETYNRTCAPCHGHDGRGIERVAPPLAGADWVLHPRSDRLLRIVLNGVKGPIKIRGKAFGGADSACPPVGITLSDLEVAAALTHIRSNQIWGHALSPVSEAEVKTAREATKSRTTAWTADEVVDARVRPSPKTKANEYE